MAKRKIILVLGLWGAMVLVAVQTLSQAGSTNGAQSPPDPNLRRGKTAKELREEMQKRFPGPRLDPERLRNMTEQQRKDELAKVRRQRELEAQRRRQQAKKSDPERAEQDAKWKAAREQRLKELRDRSAEERREFLREKCALGVTDEQWAVIKPKLQRIRDLRSSPRSSSGLAMTSWGSSQTNTGSGQGGSIPTWQWNADWLDLPFAQRTEGQKIAGELMDLVNNKNATAQQFKEKIAVLRKVRSIETAARRKTQEQLPEIQRQLRGVLTTRQEAALVLMGWL